MRLVEPRLLRGELPAQRLATMAVAPIEDFASEECGDGDCGSAFVQFAERRLQQFAGGGVHFHGGELCPANGIDLRAHVLGAERKGPANALAGPIEVEFVQQRSVLRVEHRTITDARL